MGNGKGQGRGRGKGGSGRPMGRDETVSRKLSWLLRHGAKQAGVKMEAGGWVNVADVLAWNDAKRLNFTFDEIREVVETNEKKRFQITPASALSLPSPLQSSSQPADSIPKESQQEGDQAQQDSSSKSITPVSVITALLTLDPQQPHEPSRHMIRATQGHSLKNVEADDLLTPITTDDIPAKIPQYVVHGTTPASWEKILATGGMKTMGRQHMHFAARVTGGDEAVISGMRSSATVLIWVDIKQSLAEMQWWTSANHVILTSGINGKLPLKYVTRVERRAGGREAAQDHEVKLIWSPPPASSADIAGI